MKRRCPPPRGASLIELLVALVILGIGASLSTRVLTHAARELEGAELGLRAVLLIAEAQENGLPAAERPAGPGRLTLERGVTGSLRVRYESPTGRFGAPRIDGGHGYLGDRVWHLEVPLNPMEGDGPAESVGNPEGGT